MGVSMEQKRFIMHLDFDTNNINKTNRLINTKMGKTSTCSNKNGKFNNRRPQNCIPKRPVACNFKTKSLQHKPPATKDRDYRTSPCKLLGNSENIQQDRMVSILDVSMNDVSSPQRNTIITNPNPSEHQVINEPGTSDRNSTSGRNSNGDSQPSSELESKASDDRQAALLEAQDISIIGNALQETVNDESWTTSEEDNTRLYQTAMTIQSLKENCSQQESSESSDDESGELVIFENTLDRRFDADHIQEFSDSEDQENVESKSDVETVCLDENNRIDELSETPAKSRDNGAVENKTGYGTEPYSPTSTVFSRSSPESNLQCDEPKNRLVPLEIQESGAKQPELSDFEIVFKKQIEAKKITAAQIEAIKRIKIDPSAAYDAIIRFLELFS